MYDTDQVRRRMDWLEYEITKCCLAGTAMKPSDEDLPYIRSLALEIFDLSKGRNEVRFDKLGRPSVMVNIFCDETARLDYLSASDTYFSTSGLFVSGATIKNIHPAFVVNNAGIRGFRLGKYQDVRVSGVNNHLSLFGLEPAYGGGGFTESYNGLASENDRINAGSFSEGDAVHNITDSEFAFLGLKAVREGFQCRGADYYGYSSQANSEKGDPCGYVYNGQFIHVKTGSGPNAWRHDGTPFGVWGLRGPTANIVHGYCTDAGTMLFIPNNNAASMTAAQLAETSTEYKAILGDNSFVDRASTEATLKQDYVATPPASGSAAFELCTSLVNQQTNADVYGGQALSTMGVRSGVTVPVYLQLLLRAPLITGTPNGTQYMRNGADMKRVSLRGANWSTTSNGGFSYSNGGDWAFGGSDSGGSGRVASLM